MATKDQKQLEILQAKQKALFVRAQQAYDLISKLNDAKVCSQFKIRAASLVPTRTEFLQLIDQINLLKLEINNPSDPIEYQSLNSFDELYFTVADYLTRIRGETSSSPAKVETSGGGHYGNMGPNLPKISLKGFKGSLTEWMPFFNLFTSLIHENKNLSPVQKLFYLEGCLEGEPLALIKHLPKTDSNYQVALSLLKDRYQSTRHLAAVYVDQLINIQPIKTDSYKSLRSFYETLSENYSALKALNVASLSDFLLFHMAFRNLHNNTRKLFESERRNIVKSSSNEETSQSLPKFEDLLEFLSSYCKVLEVSSITSSSHDSSEKYNTSLSKSNPDFRRVKNAYLTTPQSKKNNSPFERKPCSANNSTSFKPGNRSWSPSTCPICKSSHSIYKCPQMFNSSPADRKHLVISAKWCIQCLGHSSSDQCVSKSKCFRCQSPSHHTLLHDCYDKKESSNNTQGHSSALDANIQVNSVSSEKPLSMVILGTAVVHIKDSSGSVVEARMLLDSGAQACFLTRSFFSKLGLTLEKSDVTVKGLGQTSVSYARGRSMVSIKPRLSSEPILSTEVIVMDKLTGRLPSQHLPVSVRNHARSLVLADPHFDVPSGVDGIIGAELIPYIYNGSSCSFGPGQPSAMSSIFGWVIIGAVSNSSQLSAFVSEISLDQSLKKFWELEQPPERVSCDPEDLICEELFTSQCRRDEGRYVVPIMLKPNFSKLGDSYNYSKRCFLNLEKRLNRDSLLKSAYHSFMKEYEELGHMRELNNPNVTSSFVIPHHPVINLSSSTTKLRVVFNGSAKSTSGLSLNCCLYTGEKLQKNIDEVIFNFRLHSVAFTADIVKMFRQFKIVPEDTAFQHILWRYSEDQPISTYVLLTVTYGLRSAPYLACRTLKQLAIDYAESYPRASRILREDIYVDDVISGTDTVEEAIEVQQEIISLLARAGLRLRKWSSNHPTLLSNLPPEDCESPLTFDSDSVAIKVLGLQWLPKEDMFSYKINSLTPCFTKRGILSDISRLFDPMGWLSPVVFFAKHFIQRLWLGGLSWDEEIPIDLRDDWSRFINELPCISEVKIPRLVKPLLSTSFILVGFSDASELGYGAVIYLVAISKDTNSSFLLLAKSRVAPLKSLSIPRLELCGALLLSRLFKTCLSALSSISIQEVLAFSDSMTVLAWLRTPPHKLKSFVANRVVEIGEALNPSQWHYVSSSQNPADCVSRGLFPSTIVNHTLWFYGPSWLSHDQAEWPLNHGFTPPKAVPEMRPSTSNFTVNVVKSESPEFISQFSQFTRLVRLTAWWLRYFSNLRSRHDRRYGPLSADELVESNHRLIYLDQRTLFKEDISLLEKGKECSNQFRKLHPFLDSKGLVRVGGRIRHADLPAEARHPLLLSKYSHLAKLLINYHHILYLHVGPRTLHSLLQREYWIFSARQLIRTQLSKCLSCYKMRSSHLQPLMSDLPPARVRQAQIFQTVGTDFGGPFLVKESNLKKARVSKAYLCLFICFATKAVHLEVVSDLSTDAFIAALERFVSRRGVSSVIHSDCGSNYVGAKRYLTDVHEMLSIRPNREKIHNWLSLKKITWKFNIPTACHWGGIWEAGIKSAKHLLRRAVSDRVLTFEGLTTVFARAEAVLNSRPLCPISTDPDELDTLTPAHFIIGGPLVALPEPPLTGVTSNRLSKWEVVRQISQHFWDRWRSEYLNTLTQRHKWNKSEPNLAVGDMVLLNEGRSPPLCWRLARVLALYPGPDKVVRAVRVRTAQGDFDRPVVKLAPLPGP